MLIDCMLHLVTILCFQSLTWFKHVKYKVNMKSTIFSNC